MAKDFKPKEGAHLTVEQAVEYGKRIDWLVSKQGGSITSKEVLEDAKKTTSPLHGYFEWDDSVAAEKYRISQAGYLLRSIEVVITRPDGTEMQVRQYYSIKNETDEGTEQKYYTLGSVLNDAEKRKQVVATAYSEVKNWRERYGQYSEFDNIFGEIDNFGGSDDKYRNGNQ
jgi:hypothetical protein